MQREEVQWVSAEDGVRTLNEPKPQCPIPGQFVVLKASL